LTLIGIFRSPGDEDDHPSGQDTQPRLPLSRSGAARYQSTDGTNVLPQPRRLPLAPVSRPPITIPRQELEDELPFSSATLREQAAKEGDRMAECFSQSRDAHRRGWKDEAGRLATAGKEHQRVMEVLNNTASEMIFQEKNKDREPHEVDLHGLFVKEAEVRVKAALLAGEQRGDPEVRFIVGQGLHATGGVSKLKPALTYYIRQLSYAVQPDSRNAGVLVVSLNPADDAVPKRHRNKRRTSNARRG